MRLRLKHDEPRAGLTRPVARELNRPEPDEATLDESGPAPQPERHEPKMRDPSLRDFSFADWKAII
ncbi:MAG: hypothetical protein QOE43_2468, partial [Gaiellaceae bacterium]|nr:hypothetical protein [Gaiellaceae bacterium]